MDKRYPEGLPRRVQDMSCFVESGLHIEPFDISDPTEPIFGQQEDLISWSDQKWVYQSEPTKPRSMIVPGKVRDNGLMVFFVHACMKSGEEKRFLVTARGTRVPYMMMQTPGYLESILLKNVAYSRDGFKDAKSVMRRLVGKWSNGGIMPAFQPPFTANADDGPPFVFVGRIEQPKGPLDEESAMEGILAAWADEQEDLRKDLKAVGFTMLGLPTDAYNALAGLTHEEQKKLPPIQMHREMGGEHGEVFVIQFAIAVTVDDEYARRWSEYVPIMAMAKYGTYGEEEALRVLDICHSESAPYNEIVAPEVVAARLGDIGFELIEDANIMAFACASEDLEETLALMEASHTADQEHEGVRFAFYSIPGLEDDLAVSLVRGEKCLFEVELP